jgi:2-keto-4-pentenoate hydratase
MALSAVELDGLGVRMLADYDAGRPNALFAEHDRDWLTLEDAYALQRTVAALRRARGERCLGYKVGCISPVIQKQLGLHQPVRGYLWASERHESGCGLEPARYVHLAIEGEMALQLRGVPSSRTREEEILDCIERCFPVLELHQAIFRGNVPTCQELVAGNAMHAGFVMPSGAAPAGAAAAVRPAFDQARGGEIRIELDGQLVEARSVDELPGGLLGSLRWLVTSLEQDQETLPPDALVLTGSPGRLLPVRPGMKVAVHGAGQQVEIFIRPSAPPPPDGTERTTNPSAPPRAF